MTATYERRERTSVVLLMYALTGGVVWWALHLVVSAALVPASCTHQLSWVLNVITLVTAVGALTAIAAAQLVRHRGGAVAVANGRNAVLGLIALLFNVMSLALILLEGVPNLVLSPCL